MAPDASLLFVVGADRPDQLTVSGPTFQLAGSTDLYKLLGKQLPFHRLQMTPNYFRQSRRPELGEYRYVLNLITEPERNSKVLENLRKLFRGLPARVINPPDAVLRSTRDQVAKQLAGTPGLIVPKVVRLRSANPRVVEQTIRRAGLNFPIILRTAGTHTGRIAGCFDNSADLLAALEPNEHDRIATEFVDFRSADGVYRKYRVFFIGRRIIFRHMIASDRWNVHARDRMRFMVTRPDLIEEEKRMFSRADGGFPDATHKTLKAVRERIPLDFFGMDFGIAADGRLILFEANATMNFFPPSDDPQFAYWQLSAEPARNALLELLGLQPEAAN